QAGTIHRTDAETSEIIMMFVIHIRHLCGLSADQGTLGLYTSIRNALNDLFDHLWMVLANGDVIQEEHRQCALYEHIVDTHGHRIDTDRIVFVRLKGDHQLRADTICTTDEHRLLKAVFRQIEHAAECTDGIDGTHRLRAGHVALDA